MKIRIVTLIEDSLKDGTGLLCEHGLSIYLEVDGLKFLFDTGQSGKFIENADKMGIDLDELEYVILSHGHYDHTGGFKTLVEAVGNSFQLFVGPDFFHKRYKEEEEGNLVYVENSFDRDYIRLHNINIKNITEDIYPVTENIAIISNFDQVVKTDAINKKFFRKRNNQLIKDAFTDEIALIIQLEEGILVILGCAHPGIVNILSTIERRLGNKIFGVIGGTHLVEAEDERIKEVVSYLKEKNSIQLLAMSHCTGEKASKIFKRDFIKQYLNNNTGNEICLSDRKI